jgi:Tfp pilus assembly protein PilF
VRIASNSNEPELRLIAQDYLLRAELTEEALTLSIKSTSEFPNSFASWNATAEIYEKLGQKSKAVIYRKRTVELDPLNSEVKRLLEEDMASN